MDINNASRREVIMGAVTAAASTSLHPSTALRAVAGDLLAVAKPTFTFFSGASFGIEQALQLLFPAEATYASLNNPIFSSILKIANTEPDSYKEPFYRIFFRDGGNALMKFWYMNEHDRAAMLSDTNVRKSYDSALAQLGVPKSKAPSLETLLNPQSSKPLISLAWKKISSTVGDDTISPWVSNSIPIPEPDWYTNLSLFDKDMFRLETSFMQHYRFPLARFHPREQLVEWAKSVNFIERIHNANVRTSDAAHFGSAYGRAKVDARTFELELEGMPFDEANQRAQTEFDALTRSAFFTVRRMPPPFSLIPRAEKQVTFEARLNIAPTNAADHSTLALYQFIAFESGNHQHKLGVKFIRDDTLQLTADVRTSESWLLDTLQTTSHTITRADVFAGAVLDADHEPRRDEYLSQEWAYQLRRPQPT